MNKSPDSDYCWGIGDGHAVEIGSFSVNELEEIAGPYEMEVERDLYFKPVQAKDLWKELREK